MTKKFFLLISVLLTITWSASARRVGVFCQMAATGTQVSEDGTIRASIVIDSEGEALLEIENLTEGKAYMVSNSSETPKKVGDHVEEGDIICYIEAMKVFNRIKAEKAGTITSINFTSGDSVEEDDVLMTIA